MSYRSGESYTGNANRVVKIVNLGHAGAGKTTLMAALFAQMEREGFAGFTLRATRDADRDEFLRLADNITKGKYPEQTARRTEYRFWLCFEDARLIEFQWADYRGGALGETTPTDKQQEMLVADLRDADGVMMLCDASEMTPNLIGMETKVGRKVRRMAQLVNYAVDHALQSRRRTISLAIALTKIDKLTVAKEKLLTPFHDYATTLAEAEDVEAVFIPVACGHEFLNVPMPLLFAIHVAVRNRGSALSSYLQGLRADLAQLDREIAQLDTQISQKSAESASLRSQAYIEQQKHRPYKKWAEKIPFIHYKSPETKANELRGSANRVDTQRQHAEEQRSAKSDEAYVKEQEQMRLQELLQHMDAALRELDQQIALLPVISRDKTQEVYVRQIAAMIDKPFRRRLWFNFG